MEKEEREEEKMKMMDIAELREIRLKGNYYLFHVRIGSRHSKLVYIVERMNLEICVVKSL